MPSRLLAALAFRLGHLAEVFHPDLGSVALGAILAGELAVVDGALDKDSISLADRSGELLGCLVPEGQRVPLGFGLQLSALLILPAEGGSQ